MHEGVSFYNYEYTALILIYHTHADTTTAVTIVINTFCLGLIKCHFIHVVIKTSSLLSANMQMFQSCRCFHLNQQVTSGKTSWLAAGNQQVLESCL